MVVRGYLQAFRHRYSGRDRWYGTHLATVPIVPTHLGSFSLPSLFSLVLAVCTRWRASLSEVK